MAGNLRPAAGADPGPDRVGSRPAPHDGPAAIRGSGPRSRETGACPFATSVRTAGVRSLLSRRAAPQQLSTQVVGADVRPAPARRRLDRPRGRSKGPGCYALDARANGAAAGRSTIRSGFEHVLAGSEDRRQHPHVVGADRVDQHRPPLCDGLRAVPMAGYLNARQRLGRAVDRTAGQLFPLGQQRCEIRTPAGAAPPPRTRRGAVAQVVACATAPRGVRRGRDAARAAQAPAAAPDTSRADWVIR